MNNITELVKRQIHLRLEEESIPRIQKCINMLTEEQIWWSANSQTNSIGNLILHLEGNVRQWLLKGIGGVAYTRHRDEEFSVSGIKTKAELLDILEKLATDIKKIIPAITEADLTDMKNIQCFEEDGISIIVHVIEHFSYHTGQISLMTKLLTNADLGYYSGLSLD